MVLNEVGSSIPLFVFARFKGKFQSHIRTP